MNPKKSRLFALIPAAGHSRRMGQPKLTLPWGDKTVIGQVLAAVTHSQIITRCVVIRRSDTILRSIVDEAGGWPVSAEIDPSDMRQSIAIGLSEIGKRYSPVDGDGWMVVPADSVALKNELIAALIDTWHQSTSTILVPRYRDQRGHPTIFRWSLSAEVERIPADQGLNWLVRSHRDGVQEVQFESQDVITDLDTPEDYRRLIRGMEDRESPS